MLRTLAAALALGALATSVAAAPASRSRGPQGPDMIHATLGYVYFNKPGADLATHNRDMIACRRLATRGAPGGVDTTMYYSQGLAAGAIASASAANIAAGYEQQRAQLCMVARGWRVVVLEETPGIRLKKLKPAEFQARMAELVGAAEPEGRIAASFRNQAAMGASVKYGLADWVDQTSLSARVSTAGGLPEGEPLRIEPPMADETAGGRPEIALPAAPPADEALVVVRLTGNAKSHGGHAIVFERDDGAALFAIALPRKGKGVVEKSAAYSVPAGRWRIARFLDEGAGVYKGPRQSFDFCLGAPGVEVKAGDVLDLGSFDLSGQLGPDMAAGAGRAVLAGQPDLASAVRPAAWTNGTIGVCRGHFHYALELPGAPFAEGYDGARLAGPTAAAAAPAP